MHHNDQVEDTFLIENEGDIMGLINNGKLQ